MATISNGEVLSSVRNKLNEVINKVEGVSPLANNLSITGNLSVADINSTGQIIAPAQPAIQLDGNYPDSYNFTAGQQLLTSTFYQVRVLRGGITWNGTGRVTVPLDGVYSVSFYGYEIAASGRVSIRANGVGVGVPLIQWYSTGTNGVTSLVSLSAGDYLEVVAEGFDLPQLYMGAAHTNFSVNFLG